MTRLQFRTYDVFTDRLFGGNPLAVVLEAAGLSSERMQEIAREFNYSETVFVLPPEADGATARLRIFTPTREIPFAGHPTIGTAICLAEEMQRNGLPAPSALVLEEGVGPIPCTIREAKGMLTAEMVTEVPLELGPEPDPGLVARALGLPPEALRLERHAPRFASKGLMFLFVELSRPQDLSEIRPDLGAFAELAALYPETRGDPSVAIYVRTGPDRVEMRMFAPLDGIPEDPATGSAAAALAALFCRLDDGTPQAFAIRQGVAMGRPSRIEVTASAPGPGLSRVTVAGSARRVMTGTMRHE